MKAFFKNGFEKLEEMFPDDEIKATQLSLLKQSEQTLTKPKSSRVYDSVRSVCSSERQNGIQQKDVQKRRSMFGLDFSDLGNIIPGTPVSPFSSASLDISNVSSSPSISVGKNSPSSASNGTGVNPSRPVSPLSKMTNNLVSERIGLFQTQSGLPPQKSSNRLNIEPKMTEVKPIIPCRPADGNSSDHTLKFIPSRPLPPISTVSKDNSITLKFVPPPPTKSTKFIEPQSSNSKAVKFGPPPPPLKLTTMIVPQNNSTSTSTKPRGIPPPRPPVPPPIKHISVFLYYFRINSL